MNKNGIILAAVILLTFAIVAAFVCLRKGKIPDASISVPQTLKVEFGDALFHSLLKASSKLDLTASGVLAAEKASIEKRQIRVDDGTEFKISVSVDVADDGAINLDKSRGILSFSKPVFVDEIPMPTKIELQNSQVQFDMLLYCRKLVGSVVQSVMQAPVSESVEKKLPRQFVSKLSIPELKLQLREGSEISREANHFRIGDACSIQFKDIVFVEPQNWSGHLLSKLHLLKGSVLKEQNLEIEAHNESFITAALDAESRNGQLHISIPNGTKSDTVIGPFDIKQIKEKQSIKLSEVKLSLSKLDCTYNPNNSSAKGNADGTVMVGGGLSYRDGEVELQSDPAKAINLPFQLEQDKGISISSAKDWILPAATLSDTSASGAKISISTNSLTLRPFELSAAGAPSVDLQGLEFSPRSISYFNGKTTTSVDLTDSKVATSSPLSVVRDSEVARFAPIKLDFSGAKIVVLRDAKEAVRFDKIAGSIEGRSDGKRANIDLKLDAIASPKKIGFGNIELKIRKAAISGSEKEQSLALDDCAILIAKSELEKTISKLIPGTISHSMDATFNKEIPLRWKNPTLKQIDIENLKVGSIDLVDNGANFSLSADVKLSGVVDRGRPNLSLGIGGGKLHLPHPRAGVSYETKPWSALAKQAKCDVKSKFSFEPGKNLRESFLNVVIDAALPVPADVTIDWSQVDGVSRVEDFLADKLLELARRKFTDGIPIHVEKKVPLIAKKSGEISLLGTNTDKRLSNLTISKLNITPVDSKIELKVSGKMKL